MRENSLRVLSFLREDSEKLYEVMRRKGWLKKKETDRQNRKLHKQS